MSFVVLVGFMGCGKSSVARSLARRLKGRSLDSDMLVERAAGVTIAQIFAEQGEEEFRRQETAAIQNALQYPSENEPQVLATGGGVVTREENRKLLKAARRKGVLVVYLKVAPTTLAERIRRQPGVRPLIDGDRVLSDEQTLARVEQLLHERSPLYKKVAGLVLETDQLRPYEIAAKIEEHLSETSQTTLQT